MNIPIPEYCTLERASKLIGCEIGDLLHFGEIGTVTICIKVPSSTKAMVHVFKKDEETVYDIEAEWSSRGKYSEFVTVDEPMEHAEDYEYEFRIPAFISGLWGMLRCSDFGQPFTQIPCEGMVVLTGTDRPFLAILDFPGSEWGVEQLLNIQPEDMYILGADIEKIVNYAGKRLPDRSDEHIDNINVKPNGELLVRHEDKLSTKTINSRAQFIKSLLYTMYDSDVAENPRKYFDNPDSEISELFKAKGIKAPNGRTVQAWLSMVDIPFIEGKS
ncbi:hypothetical protein [Citrobacter braakii]|uniref:hypothetical protein n=1 Tax=Citrobacter braakii TaxID=57706 RepID=UPI0032BF4056